MDVHEYISRSVCQVPGVRFIGVVWSRLDSEFWFFLFGRLWYGWSPVAPPLPFVFPDCSRGTVQREKYIYFVSLRMHHFGVGIYCDSKYHYCNRALVRAFDLTEAWVNRRALVVSLLRSVMGALVRMVELILFLHIPVGATTRTVARSDAGSESIASIFRSFVGCYSANNRCSRPESSCYSCSMSPTPYRV